MEKSQNIMKLTVRILTLTKFWPDLLVNSWTSSFQKLNSLTFQIPISQHSICTCFMLLSFLLTSGLNGYVYILQRALDIFNKLIYDYQNICGSLTLNETHIKLISLITCPINDDHFNTSSTLPPEGKKQYCI